MRLIYGKEKPQKPFGEESKGANDKGNVVKQSKVKWTLNTERKIEYGR